MKVLVGVKRALDYAARVRLRADGGGVDLAGARMSVNPSCEIALEVSERGGGVGRWLREHRLGVASGAGAGAQGRRTRLQCPPPTHPTPL